MNFTAREIDAKRLLAACERFLINDDILNWRFEKYLEFLDVEILKIRDAKIVDDEDRLKRYQEKLRFLKNKQAIAKANLKTEKPSKTLQKETLKKLSNPSLPSKPIPKIRKRKTTLHSSGKTRLELLTLPQKSDSLSQDERRMKQQKRQENLESQLLIQAVQLKNQSKSANQAIRKDLDVMSETSKTIDKNTELLEYETQKLLELNKKSSVCGLLSLVFLCFIVFICMIVFIRIFPTPFVKKKW